MFISAKNRWQAFGLHLLISLVIFFVLAAIVIFIWYPGFLFDTDGGWQGLKLLAGVDFIIGPILTLMVFNVGKPELARDLAIIAFIQLACLAAGLYLVHQEKTLAVVYADGALHTMSLSSFEANYDDIDEVSALNEGSAPHWVYVNLPMDKEGRSEFRREQLFDGILHTRTDLYEEYSDNLQNIALEGEPIDAAELSTSYAGDITAVKKYRLVARYGNGWIALNTKNGEVVDYKVLSTF